MVSQTPTKEKKVVLSAEKKKGISSPAIFPLLFSFFPDREQSALTLCQDLKKRKRQKQREPAISLWGISKLERFVVNSSGTDCRQKKSLQIQMDVWIADARTRSRTNPVVTFRVWSLERATARCDKQEAETNNAELKLSSNKTNKIKSNKVQHKL